MKTMKRLRKLLQAILVTVMTLGMCIVPVMADDETPTTYSITINNVKENGHTFMIYQILKGTVNTDGTNKYFVDIEKGEDVSFTENRDFNGTSYTLVQSLENNPAFITDKKNDFDGLSNAATDDDKAALIASVLSKYQAEGNSTKILAFSNVVGGFANYADSTKGKQLTVSSTAGATGYSYTINNIPSGYYLIIDKTTGKNFSNSKNILISVMGADASAIVKSDTPTLEQKVYATECEGTTTYGQYYNDVADYNIGDLVRFRLYGSIPTDLADYTSNEKNYTYTFDETFDATNKSSGVFTDVTIESLYISKYKTLDTNSKNLKTLKIADESNATSTAFDKLCVKNDKESNTGFTLTLTIPSISDSSTEAQADDTTMTMEQLVTKMESDSYDYFILEFTAKLNSNANIGNQAGNVAKASLTYTNNYYTPTTTTTTADPVVVFTYQLNVDKVDGEKTDTKLSGAEFYLYRLTSDNKKEFVKVGNNNIVTDFATQNDVDSDSSITVPTGATKFTSNSSSTTIIKGLDSGTYYLYETKAPNTYNKLKSPKEININATKTYTQNFAGNDVSSLLTSLTATCDNKTSDDEKVSGILTVSISNNKGSTLPSTGAEGMKLMYIIGGVMVVVAGVLFASKRKANVN